METLLQQMSEKFDVVLKQLMLAKKEMGTTVVKDSKNPFFKTTYASLGAHLDLSESTLDKYGLIMLQTVNGMSNKDVLLTTLCHPDSGQWIKSYLPLPNPKGDCQGLGAAITYMRRYAISAMLGLNAGEDDDGESACVRPKDTKQKSSIILPSKLAELLNLEKELDQEYKDKLLSWLLKTYGISGYAQVLEENFDAVKLKLQGAIKFLTGKRELVNA